MVWGQEIRHLVEIYAGDEVCTDVAAGNDRIENEEEKDLQPLFQKLHHTAAAKHFSLFEKSVSMLSWLNWVVDGINI